MLTHRRIGRRIV